MKARYLFEAIAMNSIQSSTKALQFEILAKCKRSKARTSLMTLPHFKVELPMFMPVGTQVGIYFIT